ncbi:MAG TPA: RusA family crossover junction endodeoxyribonuclease [Bacteroidia bacterium]|jgi:Holliday junction resolvase RusA-like endonuclease|nr:RusA family crossover junction endodeoxyribonuclease [Bacteroidia bacterium]
MSKIYIPIKPLSVNEAWQGKRFKTLLYKKYERDLLILLPKSVNISEEISLKLDFGFSNIASDLDNPVKLVLDILQKKYGFNDSHIWELHIKKHKVKKGDEFILIEFLN